MSLQFGILGLLNYAPMTGYNLKKLFNESVNNIWTASLSQIYRELGGMEKNGFVSSRIEQQDDRPDKRIYSISEEGKKAFHAWLTDFPDTFLSPKRDEFMLRIFFGAHLGKVEIKKQLQRFIEDRIKAMDTLDEQNKISDLGQLKNKKQIDIPADEARCIRFVLKRALMSNKVLIQWAEECIKELDE